MDLNSSHSNTKQLSPPLIRLLDLIFEEENQNFEENQNIAYVYYKKLNSNIKTLSKMSSQYQLITNYIGNTYGPTHDFIVSVEHIYTIRRFGEYENYKPNKTLGNIKLLWHGTKKSNLSSILLNGLLTQPPSNVSTNGKMFGNGIYFTDVVTKAAQYCKPDRSNPYGILILAEVALGQYDIRTNSANILKLNDDKNSIKAIGKCQPNPIESYYTKFGAEIPIGKLEYIDNLNTSLQYNEYIVYNNNQILFEYLVLVEFHYSNL